MKDLNSLSPKLWVGVDVGGTKVAALVARDGQEIARKVNPTRLDTPEDTLIGIADTIREAVSVAQADLADVAAIGLGIPGRVDPVHGTAQLAVNLNWRNMAAGPALEEVLGVPCFLENDVRMAALGLKYHPLFAHVKNLAYISIGTGIAAGLILNGELYRGINGMAGEIGHIEVAPNGSRCQCGAVGCLETVASGPAIEIMSVKAQARQVGAQNGNSEIHQPYSAGQIFQMAANGEPIAKEIVAQVGKYLGWATKLLVLTYDVQFVIFGGGVARAGAAFLDPILQDVKRQRQESDLAREMLKSEMIQLLPSDFDAPLWGGIALAEKGLMRMDLL